MKGNGDLKNISIERIDVSDFEYRISFPEDSSLLESILEKTGIINPILVLAEIPYKVIDGFRRLRYAIRSSRESIPAYILNLPPKKALLTSILNNHSRGLNLVEKAIAISKMSCVGFTEKEIEEVMEFVGLGKSKKIGNLCLKIAEQDRRTKLFFLNNSLSMKTIGYFFYLAPKNRDLIVSFLKDKRITESSLRQFLECALLWETKFGEIPFHVLLKVKDLEDAISIMKKKVSPGLSDMEDRLRKCLSEMALPPNVKVRTDPFFEREEVRVEIEAKRSEEIRDVLEKLNSALRRGDFDKIFELTRGKIH